MSHDELRKKLNAWLAEHFHPARTASGAVSVRSGVISYEDIQRLRVYLDGSYVEVVERFRRGDDVASHVIDQVREIVDVQDPDAIRQMRRDQALERKLEHAVQMHRKFGSAPDGGDIRTWAIAAKMRLGAGLTERARELWPESAANTRRRELREVAHG